MPRPLAQSFAIRAHLKELLAVELKDLCASSAQDVMEWTKKRFEELLGGVELVSDGCVVAKTTGIASITGEAFLNARKKKLIPNYELEVKVAPLSAPYAFFSAAKNHCSSHADQVGG